MKLVTHPIQDCQSERDVTHRLVAAIAQELWQDHGDNDRLNWVEAETQLPCLIDDFRAEAIAEQDSASALVAVIVPAEAIALADRGRKSRSACTYPAGLTLAALDRGAIAISPNANHRRMGTQPGFRGRGAARQRALQPDVVSESDTS